MRVVAVTLAFMKALTHLLVAAACLLSFSASAQWQWVDNEGRKVFSDLPPPSHIPERNILRKPAERSGYGSLAPAPNPAPPAPDAPQAKPGGIDSALQAKAKEKEAAEQAKRKEEEERIARMKTESCALARQAMVGLIAGGRIARTDANGERYFLDEAGIAQETVRVQAIIDQDCQ